MNGWYYEEDHSQLMAGSRAFHREERIKEEKLKEKRINKKIKELEREFDNLQKE